MKHWSSPVLRPVAPLLGASLGKLLQVNRFRTFARNRQNGFVALGVCFVKVSLPGRAGGNPAYACGEEFQWFEEEPW
jgi:hypothetical protein